MKNLSRVGSRVGSWPYLKTLHEGLDGLPGTNTHDSFCPFVNYGNSKSYSIGPRRQKLVADLRLVYTTAIMALS